MLVLTSDDTISLAAGRKYTDKRVVCYTRPKFLATDTAKTIDVLIDVLKNFDERADTTVVLLQTTSPLRLSYDIDEALEVYFSKNAKSLASITKNTSGQVKFPINLTENGNIALIDTPKKSNLSSTPNSSLELNGAIYITSCQQILKEHCLLTNETIPYFMPSERSIDIDRFEDLVSVREFLKISNNK